MYYERGAKKILRFFREEFHKVRFQKIEERPRGGGEVRQRRRADLDDLRRVERQDAQLKTDVAAMRALQSRAAALVSRCEDAALKADAQKLSDAFRYSDPVTNAATKDIEHELYVSAVHPMTKQHYLSFAAYCTDDRFELVRFYPEENAEARFFRRGRGILYWYCNRHGLFAKRVSLSHAENRQIHLLSGGFRSIFTNF